MPKTRTLLAAPLAWSLLCLSLTAPAMASSLLDKADSQAARAQPMVFRPTTPFDPTLADAAMAPGNSSVRGILFHKIGAQCGRGFLLKPKPADQGIAISLFPVTPHLTDYIQLLEAHRYKRLYSPKSTPKILAYDPRLPQYSLAAKTDEYGRFEFHRLRPGRYWLTADASIKCYFEQPVMTGSSDVVDGYGVAARVDHYETETRYWETLLNYHGFIEVTSDGDVVKLESELKPITDMPNVYIQADTQDP